MNKSLNIISLVLCLIALTSPLQVNAQYDRSINAVLGSAENFFFSLKNHKYNATWDLLSKKSRETIVNDVFKASRKVGGITTKEDIEKDFSSSGVISQNYWRAFLTTFDPNMILENSRWEIGFIREPEAEIIITYKKSEEPAKLKMLQEGNIWKVGLVETFWTRKF